MKKKPKDDPQANKLKPKEGQLPKSFLERMNDFWDDKMPRKRRGGPCGGCDIRLR